MNRVEARQEGRRVLLVELTDRLDDLLRDPQGCLTLPHSRTTLQRGLEPGERVVLRDDAGEHHDATVVDLEFTLEDTQYVIELGVRLPPEQAEQRYLGLESDGAHEVLDLLGELRERRPSWPSSP